MRDTRYGSSPNVSSTRPQRGSRATSTTGVSAWCVPRDRASSAVIVNSDSTSSGLNVAREADRLREARALGRGLAVQALLVEDHGNAEPAVLDEESLNGVGELGLRARAFAAAGVARPADLADAVAVRERPPRPSRDRSCPARRRACRPSAARRTSSARPSPRASCARGDRRRAPRRERGVAVSTASSGARRAQRGPRGGSAHVCHASSTDTSTAA